MIDAQEMGAGDVEPDCFYYDKAKELIGQASGAARRSSCSSIPSPITFPGTQTIRPDLTPDWKPLNANAEADEYIRRQTHERARL